MSFHSARSVSLMMAALATIPSLAHAADPFSISQLFGNKNSVESLQRAWQTVRQDPLVSNLLRDGRTHSLSIDSRSSGYGVETTKFQHYYKGVEVVGSMSFHHATDSGVQVRNVISRFDLDPKPALSAQDAAAIAKALVGDRELGVAPVLKVLSNRDGSARLIYWVDIANEGLKAGFNVLIDAQDGKIVANLSKMDTTAPIQVVSAQKQGFKILPVVIRNPQTGKPEFKGCLAGDLASEDHGKPFLPDECRAILRDETEHTKNQCQIVMLDSVTSGNPVAIDPAFCEKVVVDSVPVGDTDGSTRRALYNSEMVLGYYKTVHGRDSYDNQGSELVSVVHAGLNFANAAWVEGANYMIYGDGDGEILSDMTRGLDVAGHEMTHGVVTQTAKLMMMDEAGALNEAYADFFGKMIAQDGSWIVGESISLDKAKFPGIRNLENPAAFQSTIPDGKGEVKRRPYPAKASEALKKLPDTVCGEDNDRCWVHFNSTVPSHASYRVLQAIGREKAERLYYLTLTQFLTADATFTKAAQATMEACAMRFEAGDCEKVKAIFAELGMI